MKRSSKDMVLVVTDGDINQLPIRHALNHLGFSVECSALSRVPPLPKSPLYAIVLVPTAMKGDSLGRTLSQLRELSDVPILVTRNGSASLPIQMLDASTMQIPWDVAEDHLQWILRHVKESHSLSSRLRHYRILLDSAPVGVFEITDDRLTYANGYLLERMGYNASQLPNLDVVSFFVPEDRDRFREAMKTLPSRPTDAAPSIYRFVAADESTFIGEVRSKVISLEGGVKIEGTIRDITQETRVRQFHRIVLELTEVVLAEENIDRILQLALDTIVEYSGFRRAVLSLYDLSQRNPFEGPVFKTLTSGLTPSEQEAMMAQPPIPLEHRRLIYSDHFKLGSGYYVPHDKTPWSESHGLAGTVSVEGWHPDDFLFIPLRGVSGIIGSISVDDPIDQSVPTATSIEPVAFLANLAAFAIERAFKLKRMQAQADQLHGLAALGAELATIENERSLCETVTDRVHKRMGYDVCGIYLLDGMRFVHEAVAASNGFSQIEIPAKGFRGTADGPGINRWVLRHAKPAIVPDVGQDARYDGTRETIKSYVAVPIVGRKGSLGVFYAASRRLAAFGDQDLEMLSTLASHLATALSALRRRSALYRIFAFGQHLAVSSTLPQAVATTLDFLIEQFDFQLSSILMLEPNGSLRMEGVGGAYGDTYLKKGWTMDAGTGIVGWTARTGKSILVPDVASDERYHAVFPGTRSELAVPIVFSDSVLGVINIESPQVGFFDDEDRQLIEVVANQLGIALANISSQENLREQAIRDPLTGLFNRHYFNSMIASELSRSDRYGRPLVLMMVDVDGFRAVNNQMGHLVGDEVLQNVARMLESNVREADRVIRYGGDEFLIFMPETDGHGEAETIAERIRREIGTVLEGTEASKLGLNLGLSIGIYSRLPSEHRSLEQILEEVDRRMYADKRARNEDRADDYRS